MDIKGKDRENPRTFYPETQHGVRHKGPAGASDNASDASSTSDSSSLSAHLNRVTEAFRRTTLRLAQALSAPTQNAPTQSAQKTAAPSAPSAIDSTRAETHAELTKIFRKQLAIATEWQAQGRTEDALELVVGLARAVSDGHYNATLARNLLLAESFLPRIILVGGFKTIVPVLQDANLAWFSADDNYAYLSALVTMRAEDPDEAAFSFRKYFSRVTGAGKAWASMPEATRAVVRSVLSTNDPKFCLGCFGNANTASQYALAASLPDLAQKIIRMAYTGIDVDPETALPPHLAPPAYTVE